VHLEHIRLQIDELEHRAEEVSGPQERRRLTLDCIAIERSLVALEERLAQDAEYVARYRQRLKRIRTRG
jgi:predicted  nucleic acid-binding Zn-ribbon protein